ncbi:hypothetical protein CHS0354_040335, partial [Potamilus streckersoni]
THLSVYTPTLCSTLEEKYQVYEALDRVISSILNTEGLYLLRDFKSRVGTDHAARLTLSRLS